ncbi:MAG: hypothetical protein ACI8TX_003720 [Hyphomicrobiaceae bacterium]|jgi:hypothetical protein
MRTPTIVLVCLCLLGAAICGAGETDKIKQLTVEDAKSLGQDRSGRLLLDGLTALSAGTRASCHPVENFADSLGAVSEVTA